MGRSRVVRAVVSMEVFAILAPEFEGGMPADLGAIARDAISQAANDTPAGVWLVAGEEDATKWEELTS